MSNDDLNYIITFAPHYSCNIYISYNKSRAALVLQWHHQEPSQSLSIFSWLLSTCCLIVETWLIQFTPHFHSQDKEKMEGAAGKWRMSKPLLMLIPSAYAHLPKKKKKKKKKKKLCIKMQKFQSSLKKQKCLFGNIVLTVTNRHSFDCL